MLGLIPMPDEIIIEKASTELDEWGYAVVQESQQIKVKALVNSSSKKDYLTISSGDTVNYTASIYVEGDVDVTPNDYIIWTDHTGVVQRKQPFEFVYKHDIAGNIIAIRFFV
jgi:VCBS repeat-containing protein